MDNQRIAHDIAVALLPKLMDEAGDTVQTHLNGEYGINARNIRKYYQDIYSAVLEDLQAE